MTVRSKLPSPLRAGPHLVHDRRLQVNHHATRYVFPSARLAEEGVKGVVTTADGPWNCLRTL